MCVLSHFYQVRLCDPMDCSPPGSSVCGVLQARILEWVTMPSSRGSSWCRDWTCIFYISCIYRQVPVFLPIKSHGQKCLVGCRPWGHKELGTNERLTHSTHLYHWRHLGSPKEGLGVPNPPDEKSAHTPGNSTAGNLPFSGAAAIWDYSGSPEDLASPQWEYSPMF